MFVAILFIIILSIIEILGELTCNNRSDTLLFKKLDFINENVFPPVKETQVLIVAELFMNDVCEIFPGKYESPM